MKPQIQEFYFSWDEPLKSCFLVLREIIMEFDSRITEEWKYRLPFFYIQKKPFCYLYYNKKTNEPYIGIVKGGEMEHPALEQGDRKKMKVFPVNPAEDISVEMLTEVLTEARSRYSLTF